jgi:hypothetical protein
MHLKVKYILWLEKMKLSFKDIQFIISAIDNLIKIYKERLNIESKVNFVMFQIPHHTRLRKSWICI